MSDPEKTTPLAEQLETRNVENILKRQLDGKVLTDAEKEAVTEWQAREESRKKSATTVSVPGAGAPHVRKMKPKKRRFAELIVAGKSQSEAWRIAYNHPDAKAPRSTEAGSRMAAEPQVREYIAAMRERSDVKTILSLNDRLALLAANAQLPSKTAAARNAQARAIEVYSKISGDQAPDRQDITIKGDPASPLQTVTRPATKAEKIAALLAQRQARSAQAAAPTILPP